MRSQNLAMGECPDSFDSARAKLAVAEEEHKHIPRSVIETIFERCKAKFALIETVCIKEEYQEDRVKEEDVN